MSSIRHSSGVHAWPGGFGVSLPYAARGALESGGEGGACAGGSPRGPVASFLALVSSRHSTRHFASRDVDEAIIETALEAARMAPRCATGARVREAQGRGAATSATARPPSPHPRSAGNLQAYEVVVVRSQRAKAALGAAAAGQDWISEAPVLLVWLAVPSASAAKYGSRGEHVYAVQDATLAASYTQLALTAQGVGVCWIGAFEEEKVAKVVGASAGGPTPVDDGDGGGFGLASPAPRTSHARRPVCIMAVGWAAAGHSPRRPRRRPLAEWVHAEVVPLAD